ncbi:MAG TPA: FmdB family zinc ribbon protein [Candidatus Dormibacteraeota bacterium]|nr:FmdB family zinc ribbon protein [Candidatus Dormibacteraeota bacterium]
MPIYGYRCGQCGHELEVFQSMTDEPLRVCGECGGSLRKLLYPVGVHFKGSGFYTTDYKGNGSASGNGSTGSEASSSSEKAEKPAEPVGSKDA